MALSGDNKEFIGIMRKLVTELSKAANAIPKQIQLLGSSINESVDDNKRAAQVFVDLAESQIALSEDQQKKMFKYVSDGKKDTASFKKFLLEELKLTDQLTEKYTEIYELTESQLDLSKKLSTIRDKSFTKTKEYLSDVERLSDLLHDENKFLLKNRVVGDALVSQLNSKLKSQSNLNRAFDIESTVVNDIKEKMSMINESVNDIGSRTFEINGVANLNSDKLLGEIDKIKSNVQDLLQNELDTLSSKLELVAHSDSGFQKTTDGSVQEKKTKKTLVGDELTAANKVIEERVGLYKSLISAVSEEALFNDERFKSLTASQQIEVKLMYSTKQKIASYRKMSDLNSQNLKYLMAYRPALRTATVAGEGFVKSLRSMSEVLPHGLNYILQLDSGIEGVSKANTAAIGKFIDEVKRSGSVISGAGKAFGTWATGIKTSFSLLGAGALIVGGIYKMTTHLNEEYKEIGEQLGISAVQGRKLYNINKLTVMSVDNQFSTMKSLLDVQAEYLKETGLVSAMTSTAGQRTMRSMDEISQAYSLNAETAVGAMNKFMQLGMTMDEAKKMIASISDAAENSGFDPEALTKDLIEGADVASTYYGGMAKDAAKAALATKKMGMSLKQAGSIADKMLNFESFMTDMYELQAMNGPDLSKAFEAGVAGDLEKMTEELTYAIGGLDEFNKLDFLTKKKMASAVGMTVDELSKTLSIEKQIASLSKEAQKDIKGNVDAYGDLRDITEEEYRKRKSNIDATAKLNTAIDKIKLAFVKGVQPAVTAFSEMLENSSPIINGIVGAFTGVSYVVKGLATLIGGIFKPITFIGDLFSKWSHPVSETNQAVKTIRTSISGVSGEVESVASEMGNVSKIGTTIGAVIASWWAGKKIIGFGKSVVGIFGDIKSAAESAGGVVGKMIGKVGDKKTVIGKVLEKMPGTGGGAASKMVDKVKSAQPDKSIGSGALNTAKSGGGVVDTVTGWVTSFLDSAKKWVASLRGITKEIVGIGVDLTKQLGTMLTNATGTLVTVAKQFSGAIRVVIKDAGTAAGSVINSVLSGFGKGLTALGSPQAMLGITALSLFAVAVGAAIRIAGPSLESLGIMVASIGSTIGDLATSMGVAIKSIVTGIGTGVATIIDSIGNSLVTTFAAMSTTDPAHLLALSGGIAAVSTALLALGTGSAVSGIGSVIGKLFGDDPMAKLQAIATMADPLNIAANAINMLSNSIKMLSDNLADASFDKLTKISKVPFDNVYSGGNSGMSSGIGGYQTSVSPLPPPTSATGKFNSIPSYNPPKVEIVRNSESDANGSGYDNQNGPSISTKTMERVLNKILNAIVESNNRPIALQFDDGTIKYLNNRNKALNNNR